MEVPAPHSTFTDSTLARSGRVSCYCSPGDLHSHHGEGVTALSLSSGWKRTSLLPDEGRVQASWKWEPQYHPAWVKHLTLHSFLISPCQWNRGILWGWRGWKPRFHTQSLGQRGRGSHIFFFFSWCLARIEWLFLKRFSTFLDCSSPDHLTERETFLLGIFYFLVYVCAHWHFQVASFSSVQSGVYEGKRKPRNASPCRSLGPDVPRQIPFFLPFKVYLCLLYIERPGFLVALSGRNMEKYFYSIQKELFLQIRHV